MRKAIVILGVLILIAGIGIAAYYGFVMRNRVYGGYGLVVVGVIIAIGGAMMGPSTVMKTGQFTCEKCGAQFGSQVALDQHSRDKHPMQAPSQPPSST